LKIKIHFKSLNLRSYLKTIVVLIFLVLTTGFEVQAQQNATLRVLVTSKNEGTPVIAATLILKSETTGDTLKVGVTNRDGFFEFNKLNEGSYILQISFVGYQTFQQTVTLRNGEIKVYRPELAEATELLDEVIVGGRRPIRREAGKQTITAVDLANVPTPGPSGDLTAYLQTLPGVVTTGDRGGELFIRGGTPAQNIILVDNMPIIKPFHISNFFSAFPEEIVGSIDLYAGGFDAKYIGATSSALDVGLRQGNMRQYSTKASVSPYLASVIAEGPLAKDKVSLMAMGRHSLIEETGEQLSGEDIPLLFYDLMGKLSIKWPGFTCSFTGMHTYDRGEINPVRDVSLTWTNTTLGTRCLGFSEELQHSTDITIGFTNFDSSEEGLDNTKRESGIRMGYLRLNNSVGIGAVPINYGFNLDFITYEAQLDERFAQQSSAGQVRFAGLASDFNELVTNFSGYISFEFTPLENVILTTGLASQIQLVEKGPTIEPRLRMTWRPDGTDKQEFSFSGGRYFQLQEAISDERDAATVFYVYTPVASGNPQEITDLPEAWHGIAGYTRRFGDKLQASVEAYIKEQKNIRVAEWTQEPTNTLNTAVAEGTTLGADLQLEANLYPFYLSMGYGISEVTYEADTRDLAAWLPGSTFSFNPAHDRRHQLNVISSLDFAGFVASLSWQFSSGSPFTKIFAFDFVLDDPLNQNPLEDRGRAVSLFSEPFDGRLPSFHRLDISLGREFSFSPGFSLETKIGAVNAYDNRNVFYFDVNTLQQVDELPFFPYASISTSIR